MPKHRYTQLLATADPTSHIASFRRYGILGGAAGVDKVADSGGNIAFYGIDSKKVLFFMELIPKKY